MSAPASEITPWLTALSAEGQLIASALRSLFESNPAPSAEEPVDWERLVALAFHEGVAPAIYAGLLRSRRSAPDEAVARLRASYLGARVRVEAWLEPTLGGALGVLRERGLEPVVLKGAALAYSAYPEPALRTLSDVDLLLPRRELGPASAALREVGFAAVGSGPIADHHLEPHYRADRQIGVELHHAVLPGHNPYALDAAGLRERSRPARLGAIEARVLAPADALHLTCVHLAYSHRYRWFLLRGLADVLALTVRDREPVDWDALLGAVRRARTAGAVYWPLRLARAWLGAPVPTEVVDALAPPRAILGLAEALGADEAALAEASGDGVVRELLLDLCLRAGCPPRVQAAAVGRALFPPREHLGHLPLGTSHSRLRYAAYLTRPGRVAGGLAALGRLLPRAASARRRQILHRSETKPSPQPRRMST